jgi:hypothetical protein
MRLPPALVAPPLGAALALAGCGDSAQSARCTPHASPSPPAVSAGQLTAAADRAVVPSGGSVQASVRVTGPLHYQAPCNAPLQLIVVDSADIHVDSLAPPAPRGTPCGDVSLAAGQSAEYDVPWTADPTLPSGTYRLVLGLGDQPQLVLRVRLGLDAGGCG